MNLAPRELGSGQRILTRSELGPDASAVLNEGEVGRAIHREVVPALGQLLELGRDVAEHEAAVEGGGERRGVAEEKVAALRQCAFFELCLVARDAQEIGRIELAGALQPELATILLDVFGPVSERESTCEGGLAGRLGADQDDTADERR